MTAIYTTLNWIKVDNKAVATSQSVTAGNTIILNGTLSRTNNVMDFSHFGFRRNVTITSSQDLSATTSVVRGMVNGGIVTENIANPNATTVAGAIIFDSILDITVTGGNVTDINVGIGTIGFFNPINVNILASTLSCNTIQLILYAGNVNYSLYQTADKINSYRNSGVSFANLITNGTYQKIKVNGNDANTVSTIFNNSPPILNSSYLIQINSSDAAAQFKLIYMQL